MKLGKKRGDVSNVFTAFFISVVEVVWSESPPLACDFEEGLCGWAPALGPTGATRAAGAGYAFRRHHGATDDRTSGPDGDHTLRGAGHYLFSSGWDASAPSDTARLVSPNVTLATPAIFSAWVQMNGQGVGSLSMLLHGLGGAKHAGVPRVLWTMTRRQGMRWQKRQVRLEPGRWQIEFVSTFQRHYGSDIALDDFQLIPESEITTTTPSTETSSAPPTSSTKTTVQAGFGKRTTGPERTISSRSPSSEGARGSTSSSVLPSKKSNAEEMRPEKASSAKDDNIAIGITVSLLFGASLTVLGIYYRKRKRVRQQIENVYYEKQNGAENGIAVISVSATKSVAPTHTTK